MISRRRLAKPLFPRRLPSFQKSRTQLQLEGGHRARLAKPALYEMVLQVSHSILHGNRSPSRQVDIVAMRPERPQSLSRPCDFEYPPRF